MRVYVFPRLKKDGRLTELEAQERMELLTEAITLLNTLRDAGISNTAQLMLRLVPAPELSNKVGYTSNLPIIKGAV